MNGKSVRRQSVRTKMLRRRVWPLFESWKSICILRVCWPLQLQPKFSFFSVKRNTLIKSIVSEANIVSKFSVTSGDSHSISKLRHRQVNTIRKSFLKKDTPLNHESVHRLFASVSLVPPSTPSPSITHATSVQLFVFPSFNRRFVVFAARKKRFSFFLFIRSKRNTRHKGA